MSAQGWTEVRVLAPLGWEELVAETLQEGPCSSAAFGRPSLASAPAPEGFEYVRTFLPARDDTPEERARIAAALRALGERSGAPELAALALEFHPLPPEDYATSWRKVWRPFRVGRLVVTAPWSGAPPAARAGETRLVLEPGASFGSGRHATTRAMLRALQARLATGERVLDAGTGSGILAVVAAKLGAREAFGFDLDPESAPAAREMAERNGVGDRCRFATGGFELLEGERPFDALLANVYADLLESHAARLRACVAPGGWFAASGCTTQRAESVERALARAGFAIEERNTRGRWQTFSGSAGLAAP